jgi:thiamine biosynthesis protein ThiC
MVTQNKSAKRAIATDEMKQIAGDEEVALELWQEVLSDNWLKQDQFNAVVP